MNKISNKFMHKFSTLCFSIILVLTSFVLSFSTLQASETFNATSVSFEVYFLSSAKSQLENSSKALAEYQMARDGAGYVLKNENYFYVISSAYENKNDADLVSTKLKNEGEENEIVSKKFQSVILSCPIHTPEARSTLNAGLNAFLSTYRSLFDISVSLDTKIYDETNAFFEINKAYAKVAEIMHNFEIVFEATEDEKVILLGDCIVDLNESIGLLSENIKQHEKQSLISLIRYKYIEILDIYSCFLSSFEQAHEIC